MLCAEASPMSLCLSDSGKKASTRKSILFSDRVRFPKQKSGLSSLRGVDTDAKLKQWGVRLLDLSEMTAL